MTQRTCAIEECDKPRFTRGWCSAHYDRWRRYGDPTVIKRVRNDGACSEEQCGAPAFCRALCRKHYNRRRRAEARASESVCSFDGCGRTLQGGTKELCVSHVRQRAKGLELTPLQPRGYVSERDDNGRKQCCSCGEWRSTDHYGSDASRPDGLTRQCRRCRRSTMMKHKYGITIDQYEAILVAQGGVCAICELAPKDDRALHVDHDHSCCPGERSCGECARSLLCGNCNIGLGYFMDDSARLRAAAEYLERHAEGRLV